MIWSELRSDAIELARVAYGDTKPRSVARALATNDSFLILLLWRLRRFVRRWHLPFFNTVLRRVQTIVFGVEIGNDVQLGQGVYFVHPIGVVLGGDARVGDRVKLMGSNTVGTAKDNGYPTIGRDVVLGVGARVLGPIYIGESCVVGANAVVLGDLPAGCVAVGIPARVMRRDVEAEARARRVVRLRPQGAAEMEVSK